MLERFTNVSSNDRKRAYSRRCGGLGLAEYDDDERIIASLAQEAVGPSPTDQGKKTANTSAPAFAIIDSHGYIPHLKG